MNQQHEMVLRVAAAQKTLDTYKARELRLGTNDCVRMTAAHLRHMGYKVEKLPAAASYRTIKAAKKELAKRGYSSIADALDAMGFERIAPASAVAGDIVMLPGEDELGSLTIALGNGRVVGWHPDNAGGAVVMQPVQFVAAWRIPPKGKAV